MKCGSVWAGVKVDCDSTRGDEGVMHTTLDQLLQQYSSPPSRSVRDGYGGGGCGGFEVFAFLAFLLALLDLLLDLNDMDDGATRQLRRHDRSAHHGSHNCSAELEVHKAAWAAGQVAEGVLKALTSPPACGHAYLCHAAAAAASRGPLAAMFTRLSGEWLDRWPGLRGSELGQVTLTAAATLTCPDYHNCSDNTPPAPAHPSLPTPAHVFPPGGHISSSESNIQPLHIQPPTVLTSTPATLDPLGQAAISAMLQQYGGRRRKQRARGKH